MRRYRLLAAALAVCLAVVAAVPWAARQALDSPWGHRQIRLAVAQALGRDLRIKGPLQLDWRPGPVLTTGPLVLSDRGGEGPFLSVSRLVIGIRAAALLTGHLQINRLEADHLAVHLTRDAAGHTNIDDLLAPRPSGGWLRLRLRPRVLALRDAQLTLDDARSHLHAAVGPVTLQGDNLRPGAFGHLQARAVFRLTGARTGSGDLNLAATVVPSENAAGARIDQSHLDVNWQSPARQRLQLRLVAIGPVGVTAGTLLLPGLTGRLAMDTGAAQTRVSAHFDGGRWTARGVQLGSVRIAVDRTAAGGRQQLSLSENADAAPAGWDKARTFSLDASAAGLAPSLSGQWRWTHAHQVALDDLRGNLRWHNQPIAWTGTAMLDPATHAATAQIGGTLGAARFSGQVAVTAAPFNARADLQFDRLDLDALMPAGGQPAVATRPAACDALSGHIQAGQLVWHGWTAHQAVLDLTPLACGPAHG